MSLNIFWYILFINYAVCVLIIRTSPLGVVVGCCLYKEVYLQIFKCVSFWLHGCCGEWEGGPVNQVYHTSWVAVVTPTDRPKSVRNCCLIEVFYGVVCVVTLPFWHFCWCRGFCHRTGSYLLLFVFAIQLHQISSLFSSYCPNTKYLYLRLPFLKMKAFRIILSLFFNFWRWKIKTLCLLHFWKLEI